MNQWLLTLGLLWVSFVTVGASFGIAEYIYQCKLRK